MFSFGIWWSEKEYEFVFIKHRTLTAIIWLSLIAIIFIGHYMEINGSKRYISFMAKYNDYLIVILFMVCLLLLPLFMYFNLNY